MNKGGKRLNSVDGYEMVMATNYFGTFTLTMLLLDKIKFSVVAIEDCSLVFYDILVESSGWLQGWTKLDFVSSSASGPLL